MSFSSAEAIVEQVISYVRRNWDKIVQMPPEKAVEDVMYAIRRYEPLSKVLLKTYWGDIKPYLANPSTIMEKLRERDPELYDRLMEHVDWLNEFFYRLYWSVKRYIST